MNYAAVSLPTTITIRRSSTRPRCSPRWRRKYTPFAHVDGTYPQEAFGHLVGYSSNYYTYMWSLVIAKDLFTPFKAQGLLNKDVAAKYRRAVLEAGGKMPAAEMVQDFLGRPFAFDAYQKWLNEGARR